MLYIDSQVAPLPSTVIEYTLHTLHTQLQFMRVAPPVSDYYGASVGNSPQKEAKRTWN